MKILTTILFVFILTGCGTTETIPYYDGVVFEGTDRLTMTLEESTAGIKNLPQMENWLERNILYKSDVTPEDEWKDIYRTYSDSYGDCEDFALVAQWVLKRAGFDARIICAYTKTQGHAVCWIPNVGYMSNDRYIMLKTDDMSVVATSIYPKFEFVTEYIR